MENLSDNVRLTAPELSALWSQYLNDSMSVCVLTYALKTIKDQDIHSIIQFARNLSQTHLEKITQFLEDEKYPIPKGFTEEDVYLNAPPLFSDTLFLQYLYTMTLHGMNGYALAVGSSVRSDQIHYFHQCSNEAMELYQKIMSAMLEKGIFNRPPYINAPKEIDFIKDQDYLTGWFGKKRPLNGIEIGGIYYNFQKTMLKLVLEIGFGQVAQSKEVRDYFQRGVKICRKHLTHFHDIFSNEDLPTPRHWASEITNSTTAPFSDKLMMFHVVSLVGVAVGYYGTALSVCQRRDVIAKYLKMMGEIGLYAEDGTNLLIKNGWMEEPPKTDDRQALVEKK